MTSEEHSELLIIARTINRAGASTGRQLQSWLDAHPPVPSVPLADLDAIRFTSAPELLGQLAALIAKHSPQPPLPPNPHQQGTYLWAMEEWNRGRSLTRDGRRIVTPQNDWMSICSFTDADFTATDWEVVR